MIAARNGLEECVIKSLENKEARTQLTYLAQENISVMATQNNMLKAVDKSLNLDDVRTQVVNGELNYRLKHYIDDYITDEAILEKSDRLFEKDCKEFLENRNKEESDSIQSIESKELLEENLFEDTELED